MRGFLKRLFAAAAGIAASAASAGPLVITPTTVTIEPGRRSAVVEVENASDDAVDLQFRAYDWSQPDGTDRLTPTEVLVVSPSIATVAPHAKQLFRVLRIDPTPDMAIERSYRLRLNELPRAGGPAIAVLLEFLLPVFHRPHDAASRIVWTSGPAGVTVTNAGNRHVRTSRLALRSLGGPDVALAGAPSAYLLSGASRTFPLDGAVAIPAGARLVGHADTGPVDVPPSALAAR